MIKEAKNGQKSVAASANYKITSVKQVDEVYYQASVKFTFDNGEVKKAVFKMYDDQRSRLDYLLSENKVNNDDYDNCVKHIQNCLDEFDFSKPAPKNWMDEYISTNPAPKSEPVSDEEDEKDGGEITNKLTYQENIGSAYDCPTIEKKYKSKEELFEEYEKFKATWMEICKKNLLDYRLHQTVERGHKVCSLTVKVKSGNPNYFPITWVKTVEINFEEE